MSRKVKIAAGQRGIYLPNGKVYTGNAEVILSDADYAKISSLVTKGVVSDLGTTSTAPDVSTSGGGGLTLETLGLGRFESARQSITPVGWWAFCPQVLSTGAGAPTLNRFTGIPIPLRAGTYDALAAYLSVPVVGGVGVSLTLALYRMLADGSIDTAVPLLDGTIDLVAAAGNRIMTDTVPAVLEDGLYFAASLYTYSQAPTTAPSFTCVTGSTLPRNLFESPANTDGYSRNGTLTALPTDVTPVANLGMVSGNNVPYIGVRRSA